MTHANRICKLFTVFLLLSMLSLFGCTEKSNNRLTPSEETESVFTSSSVPIVNLEERTFYKLRAAFPGPLLDENLKTLQSVANSDIYIEFLSRVFKPVKPFQNFDEFLETVPPDAEKKIRPLLKKHLAHLAITDQDIASFYELAITDQSITILIDLRARPIPSHLKEAEARALKNAPLFRWFPPKEFEPHIRQAFWKDFVKFVEDANETAIKKHNTPCMNTDKTKD